MPLVEIGKGTINVEEAGAGPAIMLVHGIGLRGIGWINQIPVFAERYRVLAVDLRGFGRSFKPTTPGSYTIDRFVDDLIAVIEKLGAAPIHYVGSSLGGYIGQALAIRRPELLRSLVLCHTASVSSIPARVRELRLRTLRKKSMNHYAHLVANQALAVHIRPAVHEWICDLIADNDREAYAQAFTEGLEHFDVRRQVGAIRIPTLVLVGELDRVIPSASGRKTAALIPGARLVAIEGVGHLSYVERPQEFNQMVLGFIDEVERGAPARSGRIKPTRVPANGARLAESRRPA
ncbi:MAG TPA: alpha/beta fold hydrolase [Candidatus Binataceae bacterium]|nr:alpha/beta fold hydrolase [Candidatus Binataceae bacterium]